MPSTFTLSEKQRIRIDLGYLGVGTSASYQLGIPRPLQNIYLVDDALGLVLPDTEPIVRRIMDVMDGIEDKMVDAQDRLAATKVDEILTRADECDRLEEQWVRWGEQLSSVLGAPYNIYNARYQRWAMGSSAGNIPVRH
jgi:hypothetical protein